MRFGKRNKSWTAAGRRLLGERSTEPKSGSLAQDERSALLGWGEGETVGDHPDEATLQDAPATSGEAGPFDPPHDHEIAIKGDPTQHLLTALGRFQRQVARAEHGVPDAVWADECMNQIIAGIEIAIAQEWEGVQEALTDTARILHSYEQAGQAHACVSFLQDSYEILCLMVGDLIVDNIRSGVMQKWRAHYQRGVDNLLRAGIRLVEDEEEEELERETAPVAPPSETTDQEEYAAADASVSLEDFKPTAGDVLSAENPFEMPGMESLREEETVTTDMVAPTEAFADESPFSFPEETRDASADSALAPSADAPVATLDIPAESAAIYAEQGAAHDRTAAPPTPEAGELLTERAARDFAPEEEGAKAWAHSGTIAEETVPPEGAVLPEKEPGPGEVTFEEDALFRSVQQAMARGAVSEAKGMALRLAARIAQMEVDQERQKMAAAEERLQEFAAAIEAAREEARRAEQRAEDIEARTVQCDQEMQEHRRRIAELREKAAAAQKRIEAVEAQIRELEAQRDAMLAEAADVGGELEEALATESRLQTDLDGLADMESAARESAALARRNLEAMESERKDREAEAALLREQLEDRFKSAEEIDRMLNRILGEKRRSGEETELLF